MQAPPPTSFIAASRHASALFSTAGTMGPQHRTSSSISTRKFPSALALDDRAQCGGSERPATPSLYYHAAGAAASLNTYTYTPTPTSDATSTPKATSMARAKCTGLLGMLVSFTPPALQKDVKKPARARAPASVLGRLVQLTFFLSLVLFLHALSGTGAGSNIPPDPKSLDPNLESKRTGAMGARSRAAYAAYAAFRRAQAAPAHLHVDPEGHFTYSFSSADAHPFPDIGTNAYWGRRPNMNDNANAGEKAEGVPEPTANTPSENSATVASPPWLTLIVDEAEKKNGIVGMNDADDSFPPIVPESVPKLELDGSSNALPIPLPSSPIFPEQDIAVPSGQRDISRIGRHRQQRVRM
ncbi:hypothetical protein EW145_g3534 [Phellinidium pouzarii]|uniref:Uncharacterized protein n=1 Tax=Phellinidium pouzarii TaxID=167371 RepID=A0A4S4LC20_9AGAM|nr:hypothetical protein EW145_g3534 [Phellinidium pouzarii]